MPDIQRVDLPSGGWWEIDANPAWGKLKGLNAAQDDSVLLARLTTGWSFNEDVSAETIDTREMADMLAVLEVVFKRVLPLFERLTNLNAKRFTAPSGVES